MDHQRKNRSEKYHEKKNNHDKHDKLDKQGLNEEQKNLLERISLMQASELLKFMDNKFDKMVNSNQKLFPKICKAVQKRSNEIIPELQKSERERAVKFVQKHTGTVLKQEDIKQIFEDRKHASYKLPINQMILITYCSSKHQEGRNRVNLVKISIFQPKQQFPTVKEKFYVSGIEENKLNVVDFKRFKKDCEEFLEELLDELKHVDNALSEQ